MTTKLSGTFARLASMLTVVVLGTTAANADVSRSSVTPATFGVGYGAGGIGTLTGAFSELYVRAYVRFSGTYLGYGPASMPYPGTYSTPTETAAGTYYTATVAATATDTLTARRSTWYAITDARVTRNRSGATGEQAGTTWVALDPVTASVNPGDQITVSLALTSGLGLTLSGPDASDDGYFATFSASAQTDAAGLASLFSLSIQLGSDRPGQPGVSFTSNPLLGLDDAAITSHLISGFSYDSATGDYSFDPTGQEIDATLTVPDGVSSLSVTSGMGDQLSAVDIYRVPEPSTTTLALLGLGTFSLLARDWRRRTAGKGSQERGQP